MPQLQLPIFPAGLTPITNDIAFYRKDGKVVYFHGHLPVYSHAQDDLKSFRLFSSQLLDQGTVRQADIVSAFGVPLVTVKRYLKLYRNQGAAGFFRQRWIIGSTRWTGSRSSISIKKSITDWCRRCATTCCPG